MERHFLWLVALLLLVDVLLLASNIHLARTESATIIVPDDFPTIQEAVNNATDGDTVFVKAGTYYEHTVVNKTISLLGENSNTTVIEGNWTGVVINVVRNRVIISGLTVRRSGSLYWENAGIFLDNVENCTVKENMLTENSFAGLVLNNSYRCVVSGNNIFDNSGVGITVVGGGFNNLSRNNIAENGWSALTLNDGAHNNTISENSMTSNNLAVTGHCVNLYRSSKNSIRKNNIAGDDNGIRLEYWSNYNTIAKNNITSNTLTGVSVENYSNNNTISENNIENNRLGIFYDGLCKNNAAHHNNFIDNAKQVEVSPGDVDAWDDGVEGNYWSDYAGVDLDHDGIGNSWHEISENNTDHYPLMGSFHSFSTTLGLPVYIISISTIESFQHFESNSTFIIHVSNMTANQTHGFCRMSIPYEVMSGQFNVTIDGAKPTYWNYTLYDNGTHRWIYFEYEHTTREIVIIPELPSLIIPPALMIATLVIVIVCKR